MHSAHRRARGMGAVLAAVCVGAIGLVAPASVSAAQQPGDPCSPEGAYAQLGQGWVHCVNGTWQPSSAPPGGTSGTSGGSTGASGGSAPAQLKGVTPLGTALAPSTFGSSGKQVADPTAVRLPDGRVRLFAFVADEGVRSATSTDRSGLRFTADPGKPIPWTMAGQPRVVRLSDGSLRLFYLAGGSISAARSTDQGVTFADEGPVITTAQAGFEPGGLTVIKIKGGYRGYFSNLEKPGEHAERVMRTATSTDMLHWTMGPIITGASGTIQGGGSHPFAVIDPSGKVALYYSGDRGTYYGILVSTSKDGVRFSRERAVLERGGDAEAIPATRTTGLIYYGVDLGAEGFGVGTARLKGSLVP